MRYLTKRKKRDRLQDIKARRIESCQKFHKAGMAFERAKMTKFAASCYFTARSYSKAAEIFTQLEQWPQVGECLMRIGKSRYKEAAQFFERGDLFLRSIECFEQLGEWELLLHCLNRNQHRLGEAERQSMINKYVPIALNNIYSAYGMVDKKDDVPAGDKGNVGQRVEQKIQQKYQVDAIQEEEDVDEYGEELAFDSGDDSEGSTENVTSNENAAEKEEAKGEPRQDDAQSDNSQDEEAGETIMSKGFQLETIIKDKYFEDEDDEKAGDDEEVKGEEHESEKDSFEVIDSASEGAAVGSDDGAAEDGAGGKREDMASKLRDFGDSFEHLSQYDPDDEFLKSNRSLSIIESIVAREGRVG